MSKSLKWYVLFEKVEHPWLSSRNFSFIIKIAFIIFSISVYVAVNTFIFEQS